MNKKYSFSAYEWYEDKENIYEVIFYFGLMDINSMTIFH